MRLEHSDTPPALRPVFRVDAVWHPFWTGGFSDPSEVVEQITYLLFIRRLDDLETMFTTVSTGLFPFLQSLGPKDNGEESTFATRMRDARSTIPTANQLVRGSDTGGTPGRGR